MSFDGRSLVIALAEPKRPLFTAELDQLEPLYDALALQKAEFQLNQLAEGIWRHMQILFEKQIDPRHIILGREYYQRFVQSMFEDPFSFELPANWQPPAYPPEFAATFYGCRVHCIPWMHGCVVLPCLDDVPPPRGVNAWSVDLPEGSAIVPAREVQAAGGVEREAARQVLNGIHIAFCSWVRTGGGSGSFWRERRWWQKFLDPIFGVGRDDRFHRGEYGEWSTHPENR